MIPAEPHRQGRRSWHHHCQESRLNLFPLGQHSSHLPYWPQRRIPLGAAANSFQVQDDLGHVPVSRQTECLVYVQVGLHVLLAYSAQGCILFPTIPFVRGVAAPRASTEPVARYLSILEPLRTAMPQEDRPGSYPTLERVRYAQRRFSWPYV